MATTEEAKGKGPEVKLPKGVTVELVRFTPTQARAALDTAQVNRSLRQGSVDKYQADMEQGFWNLAESMLCFDKDGHLINGQHRLNAQIRARATLVHAVCKGLPSDYQDTMDFGAVRSPADVLHMMGLNDSNLLAAIASIAVKLERQNFATTKNLVTTSEIVDLIHRHEDIVHSAEMARRFATSQPMVAAYPRVVGAAHWWISQFNDVAEADAFVGRLQTLAHEGKGSPVIALARRTNEIKRLQQRVHWRDMFFMLLKTWNYDVEGQKVQKIATYAKKGGYEILQPLERTVPTVDTDEDLNVDPDDPDEDVMGEGEEEEAAAS